MTTAPPTTSQATTATPPPGQPRSLCEVDEDLDDVSGDLFAFSASPARNEELVIEARALIQEAVAAAPPELAADVMTTATAFGSFPDVVEGLDFDTSTLDASVFDEVYGSEEVVEAGRRLDAWLAGTC